MLDEKDLQAIAQLMDLKMAQQKQEIIGELDTKLASQKKEIIGELDTRMDQKLASQKQEIIGEVAALMESYFEPKFNLRADSLAAVNEKLKALPDPDLMDKMQEELDLHHQLLKLHTKEINALKKAQ